MHTSEPTQVAPQGIRFDFNDGCRVTLPPGDWRIRLRDLDTGNIIYDTPSKGGRINSRKRYYIRFRIEIWSGDEKIFTHDYAAAGKDVLIEMPVNALGDIIGWFSYAARFQQVHGCRLTCAITQATISLFRDVYPDIDFVDHTAVPLKPYYASYKPILYFNDVEHLYQPADYQEVASPSARLAVNLSWAARPSMGKTPTAAMRA